MKCNLGDSGQAYHTFWGLMLKASTMRLVLVPSGTAKCLMQLVSASSLFFSLEDCWQLGTNFTCPPSPEGQSQDCMLFLSLTEPQAACREPLSSGMPGHWEQLHFSPSLLKDSSRGGVPTPSPAELWGCIEPSTPFFVLSCSQHSNYAGCLSALSETEVFWAVTQKAGMWDGMLQLLFLPEKSWAQWILLGADLWWLGGGADTDIVILLLSISKHLFLSLLCVPLVCCKFLTGSPILQFS